MFTDDCFEQGASMYLFIFAFLGNFFYVLSIVTNPKMDLPEPQASQFIRDSVPCVFTTSAPCHELNALLTLICPYGRYILGSGGTLLLDVTILSQSLVYDPRRRLLRSRKGRWKRGLLVGGAGEEERRMLLEADRRVEDAC
jgi:solute carrier family 66 (lysosomal lysine-arginine transporter), member 1